MRRTSAYARNHDLRRGHAGHACHAGHVGAVQDASSPSPSQLPPPNTAGGVMMTAAYAALAVGIPVVGFKVLGMTGLVVGGAIGVPLAAIALYTGSGVYCEYKQGHAGGCT